MCFSLIERSPTAPFEMILRGMNDKAGDESSARLRDRESRGDCWFDQVLFLKKWHNRRTGLCRPYVSFSFRGCGTSARAGGMSASLQL
jgi:hypothetical protein